MITTGLKYFQFFTIASQHQARGVEDVVCIFQFFTIASSSGLCQCRATSTGLSILYDCFKSSRRSNSSSQARALSILYDCFSSTSRISMSKTFISLSILYDCFASYANQMVEGRVLIFQFFTIASPRGSLPGWASPRCSFNSLRLLHRYVRYYYVHNNYNFQFFTIASDPALLHQDKVIVGGFQFFTIASIVAPHIFPEDLGIPLSILYDCFN